MKTSEKVLEGLLELGFIFDLNNDERELLLENISKSLNEEDEKIKEDNQRLIKALQNINCIIYQPDSEDEEPIETLRKVYDISVGAVSYKGGGNSND